MNITIGKKLPWMAAALLAAGAFSLTAAGTKVVFQEDFEETVPGQTPKGWSKIWGKSGADAIVTTSEKSASGDNALLFERTDNPEQWGFGIGFPQLRRGVATLEFKFMLEGRGNDMWIGFEFRDKATRAPHLASFTIQDLKIMGPRRKRMFELLPGKWYSCTITAPLTEKDGQTTRVAFAELTADGKTGSFEVPAKYPSHFGQLCINAHPKRNHYKLFLDDVKLSVTE